MSINIKYTELIKSVETEETKKLIGPIDMDCLKSRNTYSLFYIFPLIERIILEIYKLIPTIDLENFENGSKESIVDLIDQDSEVIPEELKHKINRYYGSHGIRNLIMKPKDHDLNIQIDYDELYYIIMHLLSILNTRIKECVYTPKRIKRIGSII